MVNLRLTKMQVNEILVWAETYRSQCEEVGMGFDKDEIDLHLKIFLSLGGYHTEEEFWARHPDKVGWHERMEAKLLSRLKSGVSRSPSDKSDILP